MLSLTSRITSVCKHKHYRIYISFLKCKVQQTHTDKRKKKKSCDQSLKTLEPPYALKYILSTSKDDMLCKQRHSFSRCQCKCLSYKEILKLLSHLLKFSVQSPSPDSFISLFQNQDHQKESEVFVHYRCTCYLAVPYCVFIAMYYTSKILINSIRMHTVFKTPNTTS